MTIKFLHRSCDDASVFHTPFALRQYLIICRTEINYRKIIISCIANLKDVLGTDFIQCKRRNLLIKFIALKGFLFRCNGGASPSGSFYHVQNASIFIYIFNLVLCCDQMIRFLRYQILLNCLRSVFRSCCLQRIRTPGFVRSLVPNLIIRQIDVLVSEISKSIGIASNWILPGYIHMIPVTIQLNQIPCMGGIVDISCIQSAELGCLQKCICISGTLCLAENDTAVCGRARPVALGLIPAILHQPFDNLNLLFPVTHAIGNIFLFEFLDSGFCFLPLAGSHHAEIRCLEIIGRTGHRSICIIIPFIIVIILISVTAAMRTSAG